MDARHRVALLAPVALFVATWALWLGWHTDDAGITYAYAGNLARGLGLRPFAASPQVEGFSNPTWTLLLSATAWAGVPVAVASKGWQLVLGAAAVGGTAHLARVRGATTTEAGASGVVAALTVPFALWSASGLETALVACLLLAGAAALRGGPVGIGLVAGALAVSRPEGPLVAAALVAAWAPGRRRADVALAVAVAAAPPLAWLGLRLLVFHAWWPNTAAAKLEPAWGLRIAKGGWYAARALLVAGGLLLPGARDRRAGVVGAALVVAVVAMGGDWMRHARLLAPAVSVVCALAVPALLRTGWGRGLVAAHLLVQAAAWPAAATRPPLPEAVVARVGDALERAGGLAWKEPLTVATPDVGGVLDGHPDRVVLDLAGLVDRDAALHGREPGYWRDRLARDAPRFVVLHTLWPARAGLDADTLSGLGYTRVCTQRKTVAGEVHALDLYARGELPPAPLETLEAWCAGPP